MIDGRDRTQPIWKTRRILMPVGILLAALIVGLISTQQSRGQLNTVQSHVRELCRRAANGEELTGFVLVNDTTIEAATIAAIKTGCDGALADLSNVEIDVVPGNLGAVSSHRGPLTEATHQASVLIDGVTTLTLRVRIGKSTMDRVVIVGYQLYFE